MQGNRTAVMVDGRLELPLGPTNRTVDVWLDRGTHDLTIFAATVAANQPIGATRAREDHNAQQVVLSPFRASDFDLTQPAAKPGLPRKPTTVLADNGVWDFRFDSFELRHVKLTIEEYLGEAVAINQVDVARLGRERSAHSDQGRRAGPGRQRRAGDRRRRHDHGHLHRRVHADRRRPQPTAHADAAWPRTTTPASRPSATTSCGSPTAQVQNVRKQLMRIDPGERFIVEITDYDHDTSGEPDTLEFQVVGQRRRAARADATETGPITGVFTKEVDTAAQAGEGQAGGEAGRSDLLQLSRLAEHVPRPRRARETIVYVNQPSEGRIRDRGDAHRAAAAEYAGGQARSAADHLPAGQGSRRRSAGVAFEAPLTVEVYRPRRRQGQPQHGRRCS